MVAACAKAEQGHRDQPSPASTGVRVCHGERFPAWFQLDLATSGACRFPRAFMGVQNGCQRMSLWVSRTDDTGLLAEKCGLFGNVFCDKFLRDFAKWPTLCWTVTRMRHDLMRTGVPICTFASMTFGG